MPGTFHLQVIGNPLDKDSIDKFTNRLVPRLQTFAPGYDLDVYNFKGITFRFEIEGVPMKFDYLDNLLNSMKLYIDKYLRKWEYKMEVNFIERG